MLMTEEGVVRPESALMNPKMHPVSTTQQKASDDKSKTNPA